MYCRYIHVFGILFPTCTFLPSLSFSFLVHILYPSAAYLRIIFSTFLRLYFCFFHFSFDLLFKFFVTLLPHFYFFRSSFSFTFHYAFRSSIVFIFSTLSLFPSNKDPTTATVCNAVPFRSLSKLPAVRSSRCSSIYVQTYTSTQWNVKPCFCR